MLCVLTYIHFWTNSIIAEKIMSPFLLQSWNLITLEYLQTQHLLTHPPMPHEFACVPVLLCLEGFVYLMSSIPTFFFIFFLTLPLQKLLSH